MDFDFFGNDFWSFFNEILFLEILILISKIPSDIEN